MKTFFPFVYSTMSSFSGGKPESNSIDGSLSPGAIAEKAEALAAIRPMASPDKNFIFTRCGSCGGSDSFTVFSTSGG